MNIIHMSDLHLTADKKTIWGVNTYSQFMKALKKIQSIGNIDCIIVTGDIANDGKLETYNYANHKFAELGVPTFWCYGNHDNISVMNNGCLSFVQICNDAELNGYRIIFINSIKVDKDNPLYNCSKGYISEIELDRVRTILDSETEHPVIIAMHHPSIEPGGWLTNKILKNRLQFNQFITSYNVTCVLYGHIHYFTQVKLNNTLYTSSSSTGFAFDKDLPKYEIAKGKEGFSLIKIIHNSVTADNILI